MNRFTSRFVTIALVALSTLMLTGRASAEARRHSSTGTAQFVSPTDFVGSGHATHLGLYSETGTVAFAPTGNPAVLSVTGSLVYTAANGDQLHASVTGTLNAQTGVVTATLTYTGGTGRFADATGSSTLSGQLGAGGSISVSVNGNINY